MVSPSRTAMIFPMNVVVRESEGTDVSVRPTMTGASLKHGVINNGGAICFNPSLPGMMRTDTSQ